MLPPQRAAAFVRFWPFVLGALFLLYAWAIPDPHAFNNAALDRTSWAIGGLLLIWSGVHATRATRVVAMLAGVGLFVVRITVLAYFPSDLSLSRVLAGAVVWSMLTALIVAITLASEVIDTPSRFSES